MYYVLMCINNNKNVSDALDCSFNFLFHVLCTIFLFGSKEPGRLGALCKANPAHALLRAWHAKHFTLKSRSHYTQPHTHIKLVRNCTCIVYLCVCEGRETRKPAAGSLYQHRLFALSLSHKATGEIKTVNLDITLSG